MKKQFYVIAATVLILMAACSAKESQLKDYAQHYLEAMGNYIYGCDRCQLICPHNRFAQATDIEEFSPSEEFLKMTPDDWKQLTEEDYRRLFKGSAVKRAKYAGLKRNIDAALSND